MTEEEPIDEPQLQLSVVGYADILGFKEYCRHENKRESLKRLVAVCRKAYDRLLAECEEDSEYADVAPSIKVFTDNVVVVRRVETENLSRELISVLDILQMIQAEFAMHGFLLRGGIAIGDAYFDKSIVFGDGVVRAIELDGTDNPGRICLSPELAEFVRSELKYRHPRFSSYHDLLLVGTDGTMFVNYLGGAFIAYPDDRVFHEVFQGHKQLIEAGLELHKYDPNKLQKMLWAGAYHNFVIKCFEAGLLFGHSSGDFEFQASCESEQERVSSLTIKLSTPDEDFHTLSQYSEHYMG